MATVKIIQYVKAQILLKIVLYKSAQLITRVYNKANWYIIKSYGTSSVYVDLIRVFVFFNLR